MIKFNAQVWSLKVDHEGEGRVTLIVPAADQEALMALAKMTMQEVSVTVQ